MNEKRRANLLRLLNPRHVAVIGGRDAEIVAGECTRIEYSGPFWPVNPKRAKIGGHRCFASVEDLPEAPDAVFLAVPRDAAIETLAKLDAMGAGGVVCYTAGFRELGGEGAELEARLIEAAGDLAVVGPNCYGLINYVDHVALWPFAHGGNCPGFGAAIITQSGMLSSDLTMTARSVPFAYMISAGNQSVLRLEDYIDVLCDRDEVRAFGLHIEGLQDISRFEEVALRAIKKGLPIVALKTGTSSVGAELTVSHTGSLSGEDDLYDALFQRLGIIRVNSPAQLLETLKFVCVAGLSKGNRVAGFTCSGGGATMLADLGEPLGLSFDKPGEDAIITLRKHLPFTATVSNPLDYTTPIWGQQEKTEPVFRAFLEDGHDAAVLVQDYPAPGLDESRQLYLNDAQGFVAAVNDRDVPAVVCSTLSDNLDEATRSFLVSKSVAPMQGLPECLNAIAGGAWCEQRRSAILKEDTAARKIDRLAHAPGRYMDEAAGKALLAKAGVSIPDGQVAGVDHVATAAEAVGFPVALKMLSEALPHKTEAGAIRLGLVSEKDVAEAAQQMLSHVKAYDAAAVRDRFLVERMVDAPIAELLVNVRRDPDFGYAMTIASGGVLVELLKDATTVLLPASRNDLANVLETLRVCTLMDGYRGGAVVERAPVVDALERLAAIACNPGNAIAEMEINPLIIAPSGVFAVDALIQRIEM